MRSTLAAAALIMAAAAPPAHGSDQLNGRIAYTTFALDGTGEIFSLDPDGSDPLRLTERVGGYDAQSDWAPDGSAIVYRSSPATTGTDVWRMRADGTDETRLTFCQDAATPYNCSQPSWAPDMSRILFRVSGGEYPVSPVFSMPPEPGAAHELVVQAEVPLWYPSLSPDGSRLLVAAQYPRINRREDRAVEVITQPFGGDKPRQVLFDGPKTAPGVYDSAGAWAPDGDRIAFESDVDGDMDVYVMNADGTGVRQLTGVEPDDNRHDEGPAWSPDGLQLAFTSGTTNTTGDIHVMNADGTDVRRITFNEDARPGWARDESPDWQPIPLGEDLEPLGDLVRAGAGAYSVHGSETLTADRARRVAARWTRLAAHGLQPRVLGGFFFAKRPAGQGQFVVRGVRHHRRGDRIVAFLYREA